MRRIALALAAAVSLSACADLPFFGPSPIETAISDPARPAADVERDAARKPAELMAFAGVGPGDKVADLIAGGGYFTRLFSVAVGPRGHVYAVQPAEIVAVAPTYLAAIQGVAESYQNVTVLQGGVGELSFPEPLDVVWTSLNYHDLHANFMGPANVAAVNKAIFDSLKPGGVYIVIDHHAAVGSGLNDVNTLHRIDVDQVRREVEAAGFVLEAESDLLRHPADPRTANVFDPSIRAQTDQFVLKFRKPRR